MYADPIQSMRMGNEILDAAINLEYQLGEFEGLRLIGNSYFMKGRLDSASIFMLQLLDRAYDSNNLSMQADVMIDIGQTYDKIGLHSLAYDYFKQAHAIRLKTGDAERLSVTFINLAYHYYLRDELDSALFYYERTEQILDTIPVNHTTPYLYNELGAVYLKQGKLDLAREFMMKAVALNMQLVNNWDLSFNYALLAQVELKNGDFVKSEEYAQKALGIAANSGISIEYDLIYDVLSKAKANQGYPEQALDYLNKSHDYSDSLNRVFDEQKLLALDHYKKEKENEIATLRLTNENLAQGNQITAQRYTLILLILLVLVMLVGTGTLLMQNKKLRLARRRIEDQNNDLVNLSNARSKLFSVITHDLRNPLNNINGMLNLAKEGVISPDEFGKYADSLADQTSRVSELSETLLKWASSQQQGLKVQKESFSLNLLVDDVIANASQLSKSKSIDLSISKGAEIMLETDRNMLMLAINNLLVNAIKFTPNNGNVEVSISSSDMWTVIEVVDSGIGIQEDLLDDIKAGKVITNLGTNDEKGTGIGLMLTMDMVSLNKGKLEALKNPENGSTFRIMLPKAVSK